MRAAARALGQRVREEDGVNRALDQLQAWALLEPVKPVAARGDSERAIA
ncbi:glucosyltransferase [Xanthomonas bromi]|uniref:Glucosyltransferase n=1 Tax=Xanthomonas bromi TaxID=56449 RepID=A0A1C3NRA9_9XANT|nr:glucosyltransferase [Xanthomonas bromi]